MIYIILTIVLPMILASVAGVAYGYNQVQRHYYKNFAVKHPNHNALFWGPEQWKNKWKNGDKSQGEAFWGSSRWFVVFTDAHHLTMWLFSGLWYLAAAILAGGLFHLLTFDIHLIGLWAFGSVMLYLLKGAFFEAIHKRYE